MMADAAPQLGAATDFLAWEAEQPERWEKIGGVVRMMVGGSLNHNVICHHLGFALRRRAPSCGVYVESAQLRVDGDLFYPDVLMACPRPPRGATFVTTPSVVAEVDSPSNSLAQQRRKRAAYQAMPSLQAILWLDQKECFVEVERRDGEGWSVERFAGPDAVMTCPGLNAPVPLAEIYQEADWFDTPADARRDPATEETRYDG